MCNRNGLFQRGGRGGAELENGGGLKNTTFTPGIINFFYVLRSITEKRKRRREGSTYLNEKLVNVHPHTIDTHLLQVHFSPLVQAPFLILFIFFVCVHTLTREGGGRGGGGGGETEQTSFLPVRSLFFFFQKSANSLAHFSVLEMRSGSSS